MTSFSVRRPARPAGLLLVARQGGGRHVDVGERGADQGVTSLLRMTTRTWS